MSTTEKNPTSELEALLRTPCVEPDYRFDVAPTSGSIAFSYNATGRWQIYLIQGGAGLPAKITHGPGAKFAPRWSPNADVLAFMVDRDGSEGYDINLYDLNSGARKNLMPGSLELLQPQLSWSPDGKYLAFISDRSGTFDTHVMPIESGKAQHLFTRPYPDMDLRWSPNGDYLAISSETEGQNLDILLMPVNGDEAKVVSESGKQTHAKDPAWSPDGKALAFSSNDRGRFEIGIYDLPSAAVTWVASGKGEKEFPSWSPDGRKLVFVISHGPRTELGVYDLQQKAVSHYKVADGVHYCPRFTPDSQSILFVFDNPSHPCDLWRLSLMDGTMQQLTHSLLPRLQHFPFTMPSEVAYSSLDGKQVPALLYRPESASGPTPAMVYVHGGPTWLTQVTWDPLLQYMVSRGWTVLAPNYRGSKGYGREWQWANRFDLGGGDTMDVVAGADYLIDQGFADPNRIAVTGVSYGGYLTMTSMTQFPDRWAAGSAVVPFLNWFNTTTNERQDLRHWDEQNFGKSDEQEERFYERSPFFHLDRIQAPVQLICGANDKRCPASESVETRDTLEAQGKRCDLHLYPDEGHAFHKIENVIDSRKKRFAFMAEILEG